MYNQDIRTASKTKSVFLWEVAERLNISEPTMTRKLRRELPNEEKQRIFSLIDEIAADKKNAARNAANIPNG